MRETIDLNSGWKLHWTEYHGEIRMDPRHDGIGVWNPERLFCRKAQMSFGWDIAPRLVTVGIWRPVELVLVDQARLTDFRVALVRSEGAHALVRVDVEHYVSDPEFGGFLLWNVADCWPQQSDAVIDFEGNPKRVFRKLGPAFRKARRQAFGAGKNGGPAPGRNDAEQPRDANERDT
jgi:hypothetical protein